MEGSYELGRVVFDDIDSPVRYHVSFEQPLYLDTHQIHRNILIDNVIKRVAQLPIDYMHSICWRVIKRLLLFWKEGPRHTNYQLLIRALLVNCILYIT